MHRGWTFRAASLVVAVAALAAGLCLPARAEAQGARAETPGPPTVEPVQSPHPNLASSLHDDVAAGQAVLPAGALLDGGIEVAADAPVTVVVEADDPEAARVAVEAAGGTVTIELDDRVQADVPVDALLDIAGANGVGYVREPMAVVPTATSEGVATIGAAAWHGAGFDGSGIKVAVLDVGFAGYLSQVGPSGELGASVTTDFSRCANPTGDEHGTGVAEIVHDVAPAAALHLVCVGTAEGVISALEDMDAAGVDVVNGSIGVVGVGRGDGSGGETTTISGAVRALRRQGILYVASAGNYGTTHWHGAAVGDNPPNANDFVNLTPQDDMLFAVAGNGVARVVIQWDQWTGPRTDFDLFINSNCGLISSQNRQGSGAPPVEFLMVPNCSSSVTTYSIWVNRFSGSGTPRLDIYLDGPTSNIEVPTGSSLGDPGSSEAALSVGSHCVHDNTLQPYSSVGPTIDGRVEPDISGPDANSGSVYGPSSDCDSGFTGTSAAAPHVAGAAALLLEANPGLEVAELQQLLEGRAVDAGAAGRDNGFGAGRLTLGAAGDAATPTPLAFTPMVPVRLYDTRPGQLGAAESPARGTPVGPGQFLEVPVRGIAGVPGDAVAVALNVTVTQPTARGHLTVQPGTSTPTTSNLNFFIGQTVAQQVTATVGSGNRVRVFNAVGNSHVVVDVTGWYGPNAAAGVPATDLFNALAAPVRAFDSRAGQGYAEVANRTTRLASGEEVVVDLDRPGGVPVGATAAIVNLTVTQSTTGGHITAFPADSALPTTSNLNYSTGQTVANLAVVPLDSSGRMRIRSHGSPHVIVDVIGWFQEGVGAGYVALTPRRVLDTRSGMGLRLGAVAAASAHDQIVGRYTGVPADAEAVVLAAIAVAPSANAHVTVFPTGQPEPTASTLNFVAGRTVPNAVVSALGTQGRVRFDVAAGTTHLVADVSGYFLDPANVPVPLGSPP